MNDWQLAGRAAFVSQLTAAGWDVSGWEILFADDHNLTPEAQAEHKNASFNLRLSYFVEKQYLFFEAVAKVGELALTLRLYPAGDVKSVVELIIKWQDILAEDNFPKLVEELKPLCRQILFEKGDELIEIT